MNSDGARPPLRNWWSSSLRASFSRRRCSCERASSRSVVGESDEACEIAPGRRRSSGDGTAALAVGVMTAAVTWPRSTERWRRMAASPASMCRARLLRRRTEPHENFAKGTTTR